MKPQFRISTNFHFSLTTALTSSLHYFSLRKLTQLHRPGIDRRDSLTLNDHFTDYTDYAV